jgi:hypothetical protein
VNEPLPNDPEAIDPSLENPEEEIVIKREILEKIEDALKVERDFRQTGQKVQKIYRGELDASGQSNRSKSRFNMLNSNTSILLPSIFSQPPKPEVRGRGIVSNPILDNAMEALEKTSTVVFDSTEVFEAIKAAVKEVLLPGRGVIRVRWDPIVETTDVTGEDGQTMTIHEKVLDQIYLEHVYWEDFLHEPANKWVDVTWVAFRHLFSKDQFQANFASSASVQKLEAEGKLGDIFKWTDRSASKIKSTDGGEHNEGLQDVTKKALVWEFWDKTTREVYWLCHDMDGHVVRIDADPLDLKNFFPVPQPLLGVITTDKMLPTAEYTIYQDLAVEIDDTTERIGAMVKRIKVRGAYNGAQEELASILKQEDGQMTAVNGVDYGFDISNHIYVVPISEHIQAIQVLQQSREMAKQALYEVTGISDILRGQTRASETLGAQRIKSQFASLRIDDRKRGVEHFCRDILRIICEIVAEHFSPESIYYLTGVELMPESLELLRSDALRIAHLDIETDSTIAPDESHDQEAMSALMQSLALVLQQVGPMVQQQMMPLPVAVELVRMATKPFKHSRNLHKVLDQYLEMMQSPEQSQGQPQGPQLVQGAA